jgi:hypothetical protein
MLSTTAVFPCNYLLVPPKVQLYYSMKFQVRLVTQYHYHIWLIVDQAVGLPKLGFTTNRCDACIMVSFPTFII